MRLRLLSLATLLVVTTSCHRNAPVAPLPMHHIPPPDPADVENVLFLVGDAGNAIWERSPLPRRLAGEVERWARALGKDSSVAVLFLGDNIYPVGLRTEPAFFAEDSSHLEAQVQIVAGPAARAHKAFGMFIAGNHDWGHNYGPVGQQRLRNQEDFLARRHARGIDVQLLPKAGVPGPGVIDLGRHIRFVLFDTAWWLLSADREEKLRTMARLEEAMRTRGARDVIMAAHHPMKSASSHGGLISIWDLFGVKWLLNKSGASLQDLNSLPYRDLRTRLEEVFGRTGPPLIFVGGHDHSLQALQAVSPEEPRFMLVSGAGSKSSKIGSKEGMMYRNEGPGYMQVIVRKNGGIDLFIYHAPPEYMMCMPGTPQVQEACVQKALAAYQTDHSMTLK
ncbi:MAG TPA: hypothetical protein VF021_01155 [Longimicrobiales bacterium]